MSCQCLYHSRANILSRAVFQSLWHSSLPMLLTGWSLLTFAFGSIGVRGFFVPSPQLSRRQSSRKRFLHLCCLTGSSLMIGGSNSGDRRSRCSVAVWPTLALPQDLRQSAGLIAPFTPSCSFQTPYSFPHSTRGYIYSVDSMRTAD